MGSHLLLRIHAYGYHWPVRVLLLSSGWDQVGPRWKCHPKSFFNKIKKTFRETLTRVLAQAPYAAKAKRIRLTLKALQEQRQGS